MLPTPSTSHVSFDTIYEPAEDSYLFLDTLSSPSESAWLSSRFNTSNSLTSTSTSTYTSTPATQTASSPPPPLIVEVGTGSGVVLAFVAAHSQQIFGRGDILALGTDVNRNACLATRETVLRAVRERQEHSISFTSTSTSTPTSLPHTTKTSSGRNRHQIYLSSITADLCTPLRAGSVDVLLFNPPYVPTEELPALPSSSSKTGKGKYESADARKTVTSEMSRSERFEYESYLLSLSYAGGLDGMETTNRLLSMIPDVLSRERGVAYVLLCAQNKPQEVMQRVRGWDGGGWMAEIVGRSGMQAGWEKLVIVRIWRGKEDADKMQG